MAVLKPPREVFNKVAGSGVVVDSSFIVAPVVCWV